MKDDLTSYAKRIISIVSQPTYLSIIITALFYLVITNYYISFFERLSLPFLTLNLPLNFYLSAGYYLLKFLYYFVTLVIAFYILLISFFMIRDKLFSARKYKIAGYAIFVLLLIAVIIFFMNLVSFEQINALSFGLLCLILIISYKIKLEKSEFKQIILLIIILYIIGSFVYVPYLFGQDAAANLIRGYSTNYEVQLDLKDKNIVMPNSTFILILQSNGNYYLVEKSNPVPQNVKLYVIPEDEIKMITLINHPQSHRDTIFSKVITDFWG